MLNETSFYTEEELRNLGFSYIGKNNKISKFARFYGISKIKIGNNVRIDDFCILSGKIELSDNIHIAAYSALYGGDEGIYIYDFAGISSRVSVYSCSDDYSGMAMTNPTIPDVYKKLDKAPVYIEKHVIVGSTSVIMPGVTLKEGSSFGCFSYINHDSEKWSINAGIPFSKIKERRKDLLLLEEKYIQNEKNNE